MVNLPSIISRTSRRSSTRRNRHIVTEAGDRRSTLWPQARPSRLRASALGVLLLGLACCLGTARAGAIEPDSCRTIRFSDVGWTDITATTALTARLLEGLRYRTVTQILSIPVTYAS